MIRTKNELNQCLQQDAAANYRVKINPKLFGDEIWKFIVSMRWLEFLCGRRKNSIVSLLQLLFHKLRYRRLSLKLCYSIPVGRIGEGVSLVHYGTIVINGNVRIGKNCRIHEGVTIGATNGSDKAPIIGNNVFIASGAKIIGDITIADNVVIAANAVVVKSIHESGTTWGGIPAKKISDNDSKSNLSPLLFKEDT